MKRAFFVVMGLCILTALCVISCDDDDPIAPCPSPKFYADGVLHFSSDLYMYAYIYNIGGSQIKVDSVLVGDSLCYLEQYWQSAPGDLYCYAYYEEDGDSDYDPGDEVTVTIYSGSESSAASVNLLDQSEELEIIDPPGNTTILYGSSLDITWAKFPFAEWYALQFYINYDSAESTYGRYVFDYSTDTTYNVPVSFADEDNNYYTVYIYPVSGPNPTSISGNWSGDLVTGKLWSFAPNDYIQVTLSDMIPVNLSYGSHENPLTPEEIIRGVFEAYK